MSYPCYRCVRVQWIFGETEPFGLNPNFFLLMPSHSFHIQLGKLLSLLDACIQTIELCLCHRTLFYSFDAATRNKNKYYYLCVLCVLCVVPEHLALFLTPRFFSLFLLSKCVWVCLCRISLALGSQFSYEIFIRDV